jgi:hypothetical protein
MTENLFKGEISQIKNLNSIDDSFDLLELHTQLSSLKNPKRLQKPKKIKQPYYSKKSRKTTIYTNKRSIAEIYQEAKSLSREKLALHSNNSDLNFLNKKRLKNLKKKSKKISNEFFSPGRKKLTDKKNRYVYSKKKEPKNKVRGNVRKMSFQSSYRKSGRLDTFLKKEKPRTEKTLDLSVTGMKKGGLFRTRKADEVVNLDSKLVQKFKDLQKNQGYKENLVNFLEGQNGSYPMLTKSPKHKKQKKGKKIYTSQSKIQRVQKSPKRRRKHKNHFTSLSPNDKKSENPLIYKSFHSGDYKKSKKRLPTMIGHQTERMRDTANTNESFNKTEYCLNNTLSMVVKDTEKKGNSRILETSKKGRKKKRIREVPALNLDALEYDKASGLLFEKKKTIDREDGRRKLFANSEEKSLRQKNKNLYVNIYNQLSTNNQNIDSGKELVGLESDEDGRVMMIKLEENFLANRTEEGEGLGEDDEGNEILNLNDYDSLRVEVKGEEDDTDKLRRLLSSERKPKKRKPDVHNLTLSGDKTNIWNHDDRQLMTDRLERGDALELVKKKKSNKFLKELRESLGLEFRQMSRESQAFESSRRKNNQILDKFKKEQRRALIKNLLLQEKEYKGEIEQKQKPDQPLQKKDPEPPTKPETVPKPQIIGREKELSRIIEKSKKVKNSLINFSEF